MDAANARHPWSHNDHYHAWILRHLPVNRERALDVGCGRGGLLVRLAPRFATVHGTDVDAEMREAAVQRCASLANVRVDSTELDRAESGHYDLVTMVASIHHLGERDALAAAATALASGGRLLVVGLAEPRSGLDRAWDVAGLVANPVVGLVKHPRAERRPPRPPAIPVRDPQLSLAEIRGLASRLLPGSRVRRRLFFRYTLEWTRPVR